MPEIEQRAHARFALVGRDDARLDLARAPDRMGERFRIAPREFLGVHLQPVEERSIVDGAVLHHLGESRRVFRLRQRGEGLRIGDDGARLMKGANHVLAERVVDRGLAANRRVDLQVRNAALIGGRGKAGQIADDAASERHDDAPAIGVRREQRVEDAIEGFPGLRGLAVGKHDALHASPGRSERRLEARRVQRGDGPVGDDGT